MAPKVGVTHFFSNLLKIKHGVQGLQVFAFCVVTANDKHTEPRLKRKRRG